MSVVLCLVGAGCTSGGPADSDRSERVPSVFGLSWTRAVDRLEAAGLEVELDRDYSCTLPESRVIETDPATGLVASEGEVRLVVSQGVAPDADCFAGPIGIDWELLDFARGLAPAPGFAESVTYVLDDGEPVELTEKKASNRHTWSGGSALALMAEAAEATRQPDLAEPAQLPVLGARDGVPPDRGCGVPRPAGAPQGRAHTLTLGFEGEVCPLTIDLYLSDEAWEEDVEIEAIVARSPRPDPGVEIAVPDVRRLPLATARAELARVGFTVDANRHRLCSTTGDRLEIAPRVGTRAPAGTTVTVDEYLAPTDPPCARLASAGDDLRRFAAGGTAPAFADEVRLMIGYARQATLTADEASRLGSWEVCAESVCLADGLDRLAAVAEPVRRYEWDDVPDNAAYCLLTDLGGLPLDLAAQQAITLAAADSVSCSDYWDLDVWVDRRGRIGAVNYGHYSPNP